MTALRPDANYRLFRYGARAVIAVPRGRAATVRAGIRCYRTETPRRALYRAALLLSATLRCEALLAPAGPLPLPPGVAPTILDWLATADRAPSIVVQWPPQADRGRLYLHVLDGAGHPICFVKVSTDDANDALLLREAATLTHVGRLPRQRLELPAVLDILRADGHVMLVLAALPAGRVGRIPYPAEVVAEYAAGAGTVGAAALAALPWFEHGFTRARGLHPRFRAELAAYLGEDRGWTLGRAHGDLSVHNLVAARDRLWLFDWEESVADAPAAADRVGFALSGSARRIIRRPERWRRIVDRAAPELATLPRAELMLALVFRRSRHLSDAAAVLGHWHLSDGWGRA